MKQVRTILFVGILLFIVFSALQLVGLFWPNVHIDNGAWWPDKGYGSTDIFIWNKVSIIYDDTYLWTPSTKDSIEQVHLRQANQFIKSIK